MLYPNPLSPLRACLKEVISHLYSFPFLSIMLNLYYTTAVCYVLQMTWNCTRLFEPTKIVNFSKPSSEFKFTNSLKSLNCALVRPILEYGSVVWDPFFSDLCRQLEGVQRKFLNYASYTLEIPCLHMIIPLSHRNSTYLH